MNVADGGERKRERKWSEKKARESGPRGMTGEEEVHYVSEVRDRASEEETKSRG